MARPVVVFPDPRADQGRHPHGRIIYPGHQWAFELDSGWEAKMERCQPTFDVRIEDGRVLVDLDSAASRIEKALLSHGVDPLADPAPTT